MFAMQGVYCYEKNIIEYDISFQHPLKLTRCDNVYSTQNKINKNEVKDSEENPPRSYGPQYTIIRGGLAINISIYHFLKVRGRNF